MGQFAFTPTETGPSREWQQPGRACRTSCTQSTLFVHACLTLTALGRLRVPTDATAADSEGFAPASGRLLLLAMVPLRELLDCSHVASPAGPQLLAAIAGPCLDCKGCLLCQYSNRGSDVCRPRVRSRSRDPRALIQELLYYSRCRQRVTSGYRYP